MNARVQKNGCAHVVADKTPDGLPNPLLDRCLWEIAETECWGEPQCWVIHFYFQQTVDSNFSPTCANGKGDGMGPLAAGGGLAGYPSWVLVVLASLGHGPRDNFPEGVGRWLARIIAI